jgi:hypothetical protein
MFQCLNPIRLVISHNFVCLLADVPTYSVLVLSLTSPTRWGPLASQLKKAGWDFSEANNSDKEEGFYFNSVFREVVWHNFYLWCLDILFLPFGMVVAVTVYRLPRMKRRMDAAADRATVASPADSEIRWIAIQEFLQILVDLLCLPPFVLVLGTVYRLRRLVGKKWTSDDGRSWRPQGKMRRATWVEAAGVIVDLPCTFRMDIAPFPVPPCWGLLCAIFVGGVRPLILSSCVLMFSNLLLCFLLVWCVCAFDASLVHCSYPLISGACSWLSDDRCFLSVFVGSVCALAHVDMCASVVSPCGHVAMWARAWLTGSAVWDFRLLVLFFLRSVRRYAHVLERTLVQASRSG